MRIVNRQERILTLERIQVIERTRTLERTTALERIQVIEQTRTAVRTLTLDRQIDRQTDLYLDLQPGQQLTLVQTADAVQVEEEDEKLLY